MANRTPSDISWADTPPPDDNRHIPIINAPAVGYFRGVVVSRRLTGVWTHYVEPRTVPCTRATGQCICIQDQLGARWRGYLSVRAGQDGMLYLVELTPDAIRHCRVDFDNPDLDLRGCRLALYRAAKTKRAPVRVEIERVAAVPDQLPPEPDVKAALIRIWNGPTRRNLGESA